MKYDNAEVLAPVGGGEQLLAAVRCGADAVYLGAKGFNARRNAQNFDQLGLKDAVSYCHARGVKVHVTVNTLVMDSELEELEKTALEVAQSGADAVIIQDLAVLRLFRDRCPGIKLHASTQTAVHSSDGARFLADAGFDRFVLARELDIREIEKIIGSVDIEAESFIHGALCMSLSGGCYLSSMIGARSGNRGLCAQPCRLDFRCNARPYSLSLKDMSFIDNIRRLSDIGVSSFKIEGRMKRPEYVAAAVTACKNALAGQQYDKKGLQEIFSRSGFTDGHLTGKRDLSMFGYRTHEDVQSADNALSRYANLYRKETPRVAVDADFEMTVSGAKLTLKASGKIAQASTDTVEPAINRASDEQSILRNVQKLGGTPFYLNDFHATIQDGLSLPASQVNELRRSAADALLDRLSLVEGHELLACQRQSIEPHKAMNTALWARFESVQQLTNKGDFEKIILPITQVEKNISLIESFGEKLIVELPSICFPNREDKLEARLAELKAFGVRQVYANNIYAISLAQRLHMRVHGGWGLNIANTDALVFYENAGLESALASFELPMQSIGALGADIPRGFIGYGYLPLMRMRACPAQSKTGCKGCSGINTMTDRTRRTFTLLCRERAYTTLLNDVPLYIADKSRASVDYELLYFTIEDRAQLEQVIQLYRAGQKISTPRTGGLYYRQLK